MNCNEILFEQSEQIAIITLNRPEHLNAYTNTMGEEIRDALLTVERDPNLRVSIITGAGRAFCAGQQLSDEKDDFQKAVEVGIPADDSKDTFPGLNFFFSLKKPVIVAYNGPAVGVGVTMTLPADIRLAAESARLGIVFTRRGTVPEVGCPWLLPRIVGLSRAAELMYTGRIIKAREALEYGLVSRVVPDNELMPAALALAEDIAVNCAPVSVALTKQMLYQFLGEPDYNQAQKVNHRYFAWIFKQPDAFEGVMSFLEKRPPHWQLQVPGDMPELEE